jgi:hypothetical protein
MPRRHLTTRAIQSSSAAPTSARLMPPFNLGLMLPHLRMCIAVAALIAAGRLWIACTLMYFVSVRSYPSQTAAA